MNKQQEENFKIARAVFQNHGYRLEAKSDGGIVASPCGPFGLGATGIHRFNSLVSAVDWAKPIFKDARLAEMYV